jgi:hypothetical protein
MNMRLFFFRNGRLEHYELPSRSKCSADDVEKAIRDEANRRGAISTVSIQVGNAYIPIAHADEARVVSQMIAADHDCFSSHFYEKGFVEQEPSTKPKRWKKSETQQDLYADNDLHKLEFDYEQNADLGTPCFGSSGAHADDVF